MRYENEELGMSFDLPEDWRRDTRNLTISFHGPAGGLGIKSQIVQLFIGTVLPQYRDLKGRESFLAEPGATVLQTVVGGERNALVLKRSTHSEISVVRDGIHYVFSHANDDVTERAIQLLKESVRFGSSAQAAAAIRTWSDPKQQALSRALRADSPETARRELDEAGFRGVRRPGYSIHGLEARQGTPKAPAQPPKRWWEFWK